MSRRHSVPAIAAVLALAGTFAVVAPAAASPAPSPAPSSRTGHGWLTAAQWSEDLRVLDSQVRTLDPDPFIIHSELEWRINLAALRLALPRATETQAKVALIHQVALLDTHSGVFSEEVGFDSYGIWPWEYADGEYVLNAADPSLDGAKLLAIGSVPIERVQALVAPLVNGDNVSGVKQLRPWLMIKVQVLQTLGIVRDPAHPRFRFLLPNGRTRVEDVPIFDNDSWGSIFGAPTGETLPYSLAHRDVDYADVVGRDVVFAYNDLSFDSTAALAAAQAAIADGSADRVIFDMRYCGGGDFTAAQPVLNFLTSPAVNHPGGLVVITGRENTSAGSAMASYLEKNTSAVFVGEEPGTMPNPMLGDATFTLPNSGIVVHVPPDRWVFDPNDHRRGIIPDYPIQATGKGIFSGRDEILPVALAVPR